MPSPKTLETELILNEEANEPKNIFEDRERTHILKIPEHAAVHYLVKRIPAFITPNMLTVVGMAGSILVLLSFILAKYMGSNYMLLAVVGVWVNWFGDSLDGRLAYYRNIPRKWYGFSLDVIMDWLSVVLIGLGYIIYADGNYELLAFIFVVLYGWAMIISLIRYKITNKFLIESGVIGPAELKVLVAFVFLLEALVPGSIKYCVMGMCFILFIMNIIESNKLLDSGDALDRVEKASKKQSVNEV
jgi:phosphatidylglycerophosphate synthase